MHVSLSLLFPLLLAFACAFTVMKQVRRMMPALCTRVHARARVRVLSLSYHEVSSAHA